MLRPVGLGSIGVGRGQGEETEEAEQQAGQKHKTASEVPTDSTGHDAGHVLRGTEQLTFAFAIWGLQSVACSCAV